jgi:hypothetical protein
VVRSLHERTEAVIVLRNRALPVLFIVVLASCIESSAADPPAFPLDEPPFAARLAGIDAEWNIQLQIGDKLRVVAAKDLAYWGRYRESDAGPQILLTDGSVIRADVLRLDQQELVLGDATGLARGQWDESTLPRSALAAILFQPPAAAAARDRLRDSLMAEPLHEDRLILQGGESMGGTLLAAPAAGRFAAEGVKPGQEVFLIARGNVLEPLSVPAAKVIAYRAPVIVSGAATPGAALVGLSDGSLLHAKAITVKGDQVAIALAAGGKLQTTLAGRDDPDSKVWDAIELVQPRSPRLAWLPHNKSLGYKHIPFLSIERRLGVHRNVLGSRLRAGGTTFLQGIGMPSASRVAYDVTGYRKFEAEIALDDAAGTKGSVVFRVLLEAAPNEWKAAYESPIVRGGDAPLPISVDLQGAKRMALIVDFADRGDECDWADWLQARLIK